jgi:hypothetical protein
VIQLTLKKLAQTSQEDIDLVIMGFSYLFGLDHNLLDENCVIDLELQQITLVNGSTSPLPPVPMKEVIKVFPPSRFSFASAH